jgi:hypothetical protein
MRLLGQVVLARDQRDVEGAQRRSGGEMPGGSRDRAARRLFGLGSRLIRQHGPVRGRGDVQGDGRLQVLLVETGEHPPRVGRVEIGVQVDLAVG